LRLRLRKAEAREEKYARSDRIQEIAQERVTMLAGNRLWMELNSPYRVRSMTDRLDLGLVTFLVSMGDDLQLIGEAVVIPVERMVTSYGQRGRQSIENTSPAMSNLRRLAVHQSACANNAASVGRSDCLMPEADTENRYGWS